jgi:hypothetical protein
MKMIVKWSDGSQSELELEAPAGATPLRTSFVAPAPETALHQQEDGNWACWHRGKTVLMGYCLPEWMAGRSLSGPTWDQARKDTAIARCLNMRDESGQPYFNEGDWTRDRNLRLQHAGKFHFHGHTTEQEAIDCYQEFLRDFGETEMVW